MPCQNTLFGKARAFVLLDLIVENTIISEIKVFLLHMMKKPIVTLNIMRLSISNQLSFIYKLDPPPHLNLLEGKSHNIVRN